MACDISSKRLHEITSWLQQRVAPDEAYARLEADDRKVIKPSVFQRMFDVFFSHDYGDRAGLSDPEDRERTADFRR